MRKILNKYAILFSSILLPMMVSLLVIAFLNIAFTSIFGSSITINVNPRGSLNSFTDLKYVICTVVVSTTIISGIVEKLIDMNSDFISLEASFGENGVCNEIKKEKENIVITEVNYLRI